MRLQQVLEKYIPLVSNMLFPMLVFGVGLLAFLICRDLTYDAAKTFHYCFYFVSFVSLIILLNFNQSRPLFLMVFILISYVVINYLKKKLGVDFKESILFQNLSMLFPYNFLFFYIFPRHRFISKQSLFLLFFVLAEYSLCEFLDKLNFGLDVQWSGLGLLSITGISIFVVVALFNSIKNGNLFDYTVLKRKKLILLL